MVEKEQSNDIINTQDVEQHLEEISPQQRRPAHHLESGGD